jgi:hypothetical protein
VKVKFVPLYHFFLNSAKPYNTVFNNNEIMHLCTKRYKPPKIDKPTIRWFFQKEAVQRFVQCDLINVIRYLQLSHF